MKLDGSCACGAVRFSLESEGAVPYQRCYCSICRKTSGGGGFTVNLSGDMRTLEVVGREHTRTFCAPLESGPSRHERVFCGRCGTHLWAWHPQWAELIHPVAGAIDTPLPVPPERVHLMLGSRADWAVPEGAPTDAHFDAYPAESIADWHRTRGLST